MVEEAGFTPKMHSLVKNAKYVCTCCGRVANKKDILCTPEAI
jgi:transcription initiation factor TFIIIB Brf1 subunit/transcription initiation factor TFIIB